MKSVYNSTFSNFIKIGIKKRSTLMNMDFVFYSGSLSKVMKRVGIMEMAIPHTLSVLQFIIWKKTQNLFTWTIVLFYSIIFTTRTSP